MDDGASGAPAATKKSSTTLSVDRAAFLLLRVKKAFKKKRQQRKERQAQQSGAAAGSCVGGAGGAQSRSGSRKLPPPLLRSRTLPAIIVPGLPAVSLHTDKQTFHLDERLLGCKSRSGSASGHRWSLLTRGGGGGGGSIAGGGSGSSSGSGSHNNNNSNLTNNNNNTLMVKSLNLPKDDATLIYRRKSSGSSPHQQAHAHAAMQQHAAKQQQHLHLYQQHVADSSLYQLSDDFECHADGSLLLRIPAPQVVPSRGYPYRLAAKKRATASSEATTPLAREHQHPHQQLQDFAMAEGGSASGVHTTFTRLAKLLHQSSAITGRSNLQPPHGDNFYLEGQSYGGGGAEEAPRRLSWERRKDSSALQRSASIDSFAEIVFSDLPRPSLDIPRGTGAGSVLAGGPTPFSKRPSASSLYSTCSSIAAATAAAASAQGHAQLNVNYGDLLTGAGGGSSAGHHHHHPGNGSSSASSSRRESMLSPSSTRRNKLTRIINDNILPSYTASEPVELRHKAQSFGQDNNNQDNYPTYYPAPLLSPPSTVFRWSEQLTQHAAAVVKLRTAISCQSQDLREMEFLLPQAPAQSQSMSSQPTQLCISRHSQPKNAKLRDEHAYQQSQETQEQEDQSPGDENTSENVLSVHRQPVQLRNKIPGNTPHPRVSKMSKKQLKLAQAQLDKLTQSNLHLHALFSAVEHGHLDKARTILESTDVDVNSINTDGLSALDVAVLSNNRSMTKMLLQYGALESSQFSVDNIGTKLNGLLKDAESRIHDLSGPEGLCPPVFTSRPSISSIIIGNTGSTVTGCTGSEVDKQIGIWERRVKGLRRMLLGWDQARPPDAPASVVVDVTGDNSISLQILEPFEGAIGTKFKVQWSTRADFNNVVGERELLEWISFHGTMGAQCHIAGLTQGRRYFLRAACGNVKGWGGYRNSVPASVVPSTWRDLDNREDRFFGRQRILDNLFTAVRLARPADVSELTLDPGSVQRRNPKKKTTIKQLFSVTSKFQKTLRRGIYFSCIVHCDDKVLVTSEDFPPVIEIDESYPSALHIEYYWLMKVACTWEDVKSLRSDMERNLTSPVHFRTKLLSAVCQMQSALGITDLGQLYYKPLKDAQGTVVLTCIQSVKSQKAVSILNSRWLPVSKLQKKLGALHEDYNINELLISSIGDQLHYQQVALQRLEPGLYLGYLKMQCSMDQIQVVVPVKTPNVLPHCKVRENSHITAEEWQVLHRNEADPLRLPLDFSTPGDSSATEVQRLFLYDLSTAMHKLLASMSIKVPDAATHRLYDVEVIEHSRDISFLIVCPSVESSVAVPGQSELLLQRDDLASLSIQAFEMIHLRTYQSAIVQKYARLSCILELDTALATHSHREAFSSSELQAAKERLATLQDLSANLTLVWKSVRWLMDVVAYARNKHAQPTLAMRDILDFAHLRHEESAASGKQLLQLPLRESKFSKTGRGSWPGPGANEQSSRQGKPEHSKSETNLGQGALTPGAPQPTPGEAADEKTSQQQQQQQQQQLLQVSNINECATSTCSDVSLRKNSGDSVSSAYTARSFYSAVDSASDGSSSVFALPPSRSDDTLADALRQSAAIQRKRTSSNIGPMPTPLITVHSSSSAPYLIGSSVSLRTGSGAFATDLEHKPLKPAAEYKVKAASSANLREGGLYLKSSLSALQPELKPLSSSSEEPVASTSKASSTKSLAHQQSSEEDTASCSSLNAEQTATGAGIIQVYTAYNTGLASGTSLKLHVTPKTTAREVINLVVKQLNMAAVLKGSKGPIYSADMLDNFCLVAVIGARERCLRDDFKPLQLQSPWKKGRLYVRQKHELLAAIEHSNRKSHLI